MSTAQSIWSFLMGAFDNSYPFKLRSALVVLAVQIWSTIFMTAVFAAPVWSILTEIIRIPVHFIFPNWLCVPEAIALWLFAWHQIWSNRSVILWCSFESNEDIANSSRIHPRVREALWFAPAIPTFLYVTWLIRHYPWLFWDVVWWVCTPVFPRLFVLVVIVAALAAFAFWLGEEGVVVIVGVGGMVIRKSVTMCCHALRPFVHLVFWIYDLGWDGVDLCRGALARASILTPRPPQSLDQQYQYAAFVNPDKEIRLLRLHNDFWGGLKCTLISMPLTGPPPYEAISWAWDKPADQGTRTLWIDGMALGISPNMYRIISTLAPFYGTRLLWIDSICINQQGEAGKAEKKDQLPLMTNIYESAARVVAFPGQGKLANLAASFVADLHTHLVTRLDPNMPVDTDRSNHHPYRSRKKAWKGFYELAQQRYWTRAWVIQEMVVAKTAVVRYGRTEIPFEILGPVAMAFKSLEQGVTALLINEDSLDRRDIRAATYGIDFMGRLCYFNSMYHLDPNDVRLQIGSRPSRLELEEQGMPTFPDLLLECVQSEATMPHDKVWAIYGISSANYLNSLVPDYKITKDKLYGQVARCVLKEEIGRQFALFGIAGTNKPVSDAVPSWVPDLSQLPKLYPMDNALCRYRAGGGDADYADVVFSNDESQLLVNAYSLGSVLEVDDKNPHISSSRSALTPAVSVAEPGNVGVTRSPAFLQRSKTAMRAWLESVCQLAASRSQGTITPNRNHPVLVAPAILRTLICDDDNMECPAARDTIEDLEIFTLDIMHDNPPTDTRMSFLRAARVRFSEREQVIRSQRSGELIARRTQGRQFAMSDRGYPMIVPGDAEEGDEIVIFAGSRVPYLLRSGVKIGTHTLVGEAYVHGVMQGEHLVSGDEDRSYVIV